MTKSFITNPSAMGTMCVNEYPESITIQYLERRWADSLLYL